MKPVTCWLAAVAAALLLAAAPVWLDGPDELDALQAGADSVSDAQYDARRSQRLAAAGIAP